MSFLTPSSEFPFKKAAIRLFPYLYIYYNKNFLIFQIKPVTGIGPVFERWQRPALTTILHRQKLGYYAQLT